MKKIDLVLMSVSRVFSLNSINNGIYNYVTLTHTRVRLKLM